MKDTHIIARSGFKSVAVCGLLLIIAFVFNIFVPLFLIIFIFVIVIFRNPERINQSDDEYAVLSPIDGKIKSVEKILFRDQNCVAVTISKNIFGVGSLRSPCNINFIEKKLKHGLFLCSDVASNLLNERALIICKDSNDNLLAIRLIAGGLCRSLKFDKFRNLKAGRRFGFMLDGLVVLILPSVARVNVSVGQNVKALDVLGFLELRR